MTEDVFAHLNINRSAVKNLSAIRATLEQTAVQHLTAETVEASNAAFGAANASTIDVRDSTIGMAAGDYVKIEESRVFVLLAPRVSGNVKAFITLPAAFAMGAGYFLARRLVTGFFNRPER